VVSTASVQLEKVRTPQKKLNQQLREQKSAHFAAACEPPNRGLHSYTLELNLSNSRT